MGIRDCKKRFDSSWVFFCFDNWFMTLKFVVVCHQFHPKMISRTDQQADRETMKSFCSWWNVHFRRQIRKEEWNHHWFSYQEVSLKAKHHFEQRGSCWMMINAITMLKWWNPYSPPVKVRENGGFRPLITPTRGSEKQLGYGYHPKGYH